MLDTIDVGTPTSATPVLSPHEQRIVRGEPISLVGDALRRGGPASIRSSTASGTSRSASTSNAPSC